tara:strand:+ start:315 stop:566 length:252 start_codon:yes stop_codon:yes gene_type:complete
MRSEKRDWIFINNAALLLYAYKPINETKASVSGTGKVWNDKVRVGDGIIIETKDKKRARLEVDKIKFTGHTFDATVTLGDYVL